jgi:plastocyanin
MIAIFPSLRPIPIPTGYGPHLLLLSMVSGCDLGVDVSTLPLPEPGTPTTDDTEKHTGIPNPTEHLVVMRANAFDPASVAIEPGDIVTWVNEDPWFHIVAEGAPENPDYEWISSTLTLGEQWSMQFDEVGDHRYYCWNHSAIMRDAHVVVEAR